MAIYNLMVSLTLDILVGNIPSMYMKIFRWGIYDCHELSRRVFSHYSVIVFFCNCQIWHFCISVQVPFSYAYFGIAVLYIHIINKKTW